MTILFRCSQYLGPAISLLLASAAFLSPILMVALPQVTITVVLIFLLLLIISPILVVSLPQVPIIVVVIILIIVSSAWSVWSALQGPAVRRHLRRDADLLRLQAPHSSHRLMGRLLPQVASSSM